MTGDAGSRQAEALGRLSTALAAAGPTLGSVLEVAARAAAEMIGDGSVIRLIAERGDRVERTAVWHPDPQIRALAEQVFGENLQPFDTGLTQRRLVRTGEPLLLPELERATLAGRSLPAYAEFCARFDVHSLLVVPLARQGRLLGYLGVGRLRSGRPYGQAELGLARDIADRVVLAIAGTRAVERQVVARAEMEKFAGLVERSRDCIAMTDLDGRVITSTGPAVSWSG